MSGLTGRCYCGAVRITTDHAPETVVYCHCTDCRRVSGAPVAAFAAFARDTLKFEPGAPPPVSHAKGVRRWFCAACGSPLAAEYEYLPDQVYVPIGVLDQAAALKPRLHAHAASALPWLHIEDDLERADDSVRAALRGDAPPLG